MAKKHYAIIDIETTGGKANRDKITEIAIVLHDGEKILDSFETLINPERSIPRNITQLTGITQEMVADAPKFYEVAKKVVEMTQGAVFVAHNVRFDYSFIKEEFRRLGYSYSRRQLCTVRLARKAMPGLRSYSLGKLIQYFKIKVDARHRAMADTMATVELFERIIRKDRSEEDINDLVNLGVRESQLPPSISLEKLHELPEETGVYYFHDQSMKIIYVGKSINIRKRVMQHFGKQTAKADKLQQNVFDISFEVTGSELVALLQESHEIKFYHPWINRAQKERSFQYVIYAYENEAGYICLDITKASKKKKKELQVIREYSKLASAKGALNYLLEKYSLCQHLCNIDSGRPCFHFHLHKCHGACISEESPEEYNARLEEAIELIDLDFPEDFLILDVGRHKEEQSVVLVEDGEYKGFGYVDINGHSGNIETLKDAIKPFAHNPEVARIIRQFVNKRTEGMRVLKI
ncbi:MAG: exonuclease domain-containing protein [Bacteroidota bacterium]